MKHESHGKQHPASWTGRERGYEQKAGGDQIEGPQPGHGAEDALLGGAQEKPGVNQRDEHVADAEGERAAAKHTGDGERHQQEAAHAEQQQEAKAHFDRRHSVRQPGIAAVHPPHIAEDQHDLGDAADRRVVRQQAGQLRDGEDKDQVEEQLEAGNTAEVGGRRIRRPVCLH